MKIKHDTTCRNCKLNGFCRQYEKSIKVRFTHNVGKYKRNDLAIIKGRVNNDTVYCITINGEFINTKNIIPIGVIE